MLNQIRRLWADDGRDDKDFTSEELKLKEALTNLKYAADTLSRASTALLDLIHTRR
jgi:hypothetical protein